MKKSKKIRLRRIARRAAERRLEREGETLTGIIRIAGAGYGFFTPDDAPPEAEEIFIPAKFTGFATDSDRVKIKILPPRPDHPEDSAKGAVGKVLEIVERSRTGFVAELLTGSFVSPLNKRLPDVVPIHGSRNGAKRGDWVRIECESKNNGELTGRITEVIGQAGEITADLDAVMAEFELPGKYSAGDEAEAAAIIPAEIPRSDKRELFVLTIDPFDAKDFDDALSIEKNEDGTYTLGIHIADVAAFIRPGSKFDKLAAERCFSCYLPGRTLPMLPAGLTAKISMQANCDSLAHSVFLKVDQDGKVLSGERCHTLIKVKQRLDYDEVQNFLDRGTVPAHWLTETAATLPVMAEVIRQMRRYREKSEEFIDLPLPEVRVICDEKKNMVTGIEKRFSRESEQLVEECMLAANQFVGRLLPEKSVAGIYRIHPEPEAEKSMEFSDMVTANFNIPCGDISNRRYCREFIASLPDDECKPLILSMLLRSMMRASYAVKGELHYALGKTFYAHFTSPIRRYTDLIVHQQLWNFDLNMRTRSAKNLEAAAIRASETEERIDGASFAANDRLKRRIIQQELEHDPAKVFHCTVTRVLNSGIQVELPDYAVYAYVDDRYLKQPLSTLKIGMSLDLRGDRITF
ncbi:MAG: VacB/RNase II family 3'-5' exoribonuclease [Lentisphaeria bacterium]|nr:VacB/RNase II family 3'-5' exoribonuclease [Lentisphaeria bacterium]